MIADRVWLVLLSPGLLAVEMCAKRGPQGIGIALHPGVDLLGRLGFELLPGDVKTAFEYVVLDKVLR